jgi:hypothetical protein
MRGARSSPGRRVSLRLGRGAGWQFSLVCVLTLGLGACGRPDADDLHWQRLDGPRGCSITSLVQDPGDPWTLYAGLLNGGLLVSADGGTNWRHVDGIPAPRTVVTGLGQPDAALDIQSIVASRDGPIYIASLGAAVSAYLGEKTWLWLSWSLRNQDATEVVLGGSEQEFLYVGTQDGLYVRPNPVQESDRWERLDTWAVQSAKDERVTRVQELFASEETVPRLYVGTRGGFFRSLDGGASWETSEVGLTRSHAIVALAVDPQDLDHLVASSYEPEGIYVSRDAGETWQRTEQGFPDVVEDIIFSTVSPGRIYAASYDGTVFTSPDGGDTWQQEGQIGRPVRALLEIETGRLLAGTDGEGIWYRDEGGQWAGASVPSVALTVQSLLPRGGELYAGTECCGVFRRSPGGGWEPWNAGLPFHARVVNAFAADDRSGQLYAATNGAGVYKRTPGAGAWQPLGFGLQDDAGEVLALQHVPSTSGGTLLAGTEGGLYQLLGEEWTRVGAPCDQILWVPDSDLLFARTKGNQVYESHDRGAKWELDPGIADVQRLALANRGIRQQIIPDHPEWSLFALTMDGSLHYRSPDQAWEQAEFGSLPNQLVFAWSYPDLTRAFLLVKVTPNDATAPPKSQVSLVLKGSEWTSDIQEIQSGLQLIVADAANPQNLYAGTANDGVYSARIDRPNLWEHFPDDYLLKNEIAQAISAALVLIGVGILFWRLRPKPLPRPVEMEIRIGEAVGDNLYPVEVETSDGRSCSARVQLPPPLKRRDVADFLFENRSDAQIRAMGEQLFDFAFGTPELQAVYQGAQSNAAGGLRLRIDAQGWSATLPWEVLYDPYYVQSYLALAEGYSITRRSSGLGLPTSWEGDEEVKALVVTASPQDLGGLDIEQEATAVQSLLASSSKVKLMPSLEHATPTLLRERLGEATCQLLHFAGHAFQSELVLEDGEGGATAFDVEELETAISGHSLRFVFLNACEAGGVASESETSTMAYVLAKKGVPLVLAMQHEVGDVDALQLVQTFYDELIATGSIEVALSRARKAIYTDQGLKRPVWAIPVLLIRGSRSELFSTQPRWKQARARLFRRVKAADGFGEESVSDG